MDRYGLSLNSNRNVDLVFNKLVELKRLEQPGWEQKNEFYEATMALLRLASITTPGMLPMEEIAFEIVAKAFKCALINAIKSASELDERGYRLLLQISANIKCYTNQLFFEIEDYEISENDPKRITVINPGNLS